jgi:hypothetical protein
MPSRDRVLAFLLVMGVRCALATPDYFAEEANRALRLDGGAVFGRDLSISAVAALEQQVKRVMGADPSLDLNVSAVRDLSDQALLRILFLAILGNYTSAAAEEWQQPCRLVVDPKNGAIRLQDPPPVASLALKIVVALLVAVQFKKWVAEFHAKQVTPESHAKHEDSKGKGH